MSSKIARNIAGGLLNLFQTPLKPMGTAFNVAALAIVTLGNLMS